MNVVGGLLDLLFLPVLLPLRIVGIVIEAVVPVPAPAVLPEERVNPFLEEEYPIKRTAKQRLLINAATTKETTLRRKLTFNDNAPITLNAYEYGKDYYRVNGLPSSIYEYTVLFQWLQKNHTDDPMTRQEIVSIDRVRFRLPTFAESQVEAQGQLRVRDRRRSIGGGYHKRG